VKTGQAWTGQTGPRQGLDGTTRISARQLPEVVEGILLGQNKRGLKC